MMKGHALHVLVLPWLLVLAGGTSSWGQPIRVTPVVDEQGDPAYRISLQPEPDITALAGLSPEKQEEVGWGYFWELGDGSISRAPSFTYHWRQPGNYAIKLHLTPRYATEDPVQFVHVHNVPNGRARPREQLLSLSKEGEDTPKERLDEKESLKLITNHDLVPGHALRLGILYRLPDRFRNRESYLVLGWNKPQEAAFSLARKEVYWEPTRDFGEQYPVPFGETSQLLAPFPFEGPEALALNQYSDHLYIKLDTDGAYAGERRCFLTLLPNKHLLDALIQLKAAEKTSFSGSGIKIPITVGLVSRDASILPQEYTLYLELFRSQDPNQLYVADPVIPFEGAYPEELLYKITFANLGKGEEREVGIRVYLDSQMDPRLNGARVRTIPEDLELCHTLPPGVSRPCLDVRFDELTNQTRAQATPPTRGFSKRPEANTALHLSFRDIYLEGNRSSYIRRNRFNAGEAIFPLSLRKHAQNIDHVSLWADITFANSGEDPIQTDLQKVYFRRFTWGLKGGMSYALDDHMGPFQLEGNDQYGYWAGVTFGNNPVYKGWSWESEANLHYLSAQRNGFRPEYVPTQPEYQGAELELDTRLQTVLLNVSIQRRYHFNPWLGVGLGGGYSLVGWGKAEVAGRLRAVEGSYQAQRDVRFGLTQWNLGDDLLEFPEAGEAYEVLPNPAILQSGAFAFADLRVGQVNQGVAAGLRYLWRFPNQLFDTQLSRRTSWLEAYLVVSPFKRTPR